MRVSSLDHAPTVSASKVTGRKDDGFCKGFPCCRVSHKGLYLGAASIWLIGIIVCAAKGAEYLGHAKEEGASRHQLLGSLCGGIGGGIFLGYYVFSWIAKKALDRIEMLERTYWHSSFDAKFYAFLILINVTVNMLVSYVYYDNKIAYLVFSALDLQVSVSLLYSFHVFLFNWRTFGLKNRFATGLGEALLFADEEGGIDESNFRSNDGEEAGGQEAFDDEEDPLSMKNILIGAAEGQ